MLDRAVIAVRPCYPSLARAFVRCLLDRTSPANAAVVRSGATIRRTLWLIVGSVAMRVPVKHGTQNRTHHVSPTWRREWPGRHGPTARKGGMTLSTVMTVRAPSTTKGPRGLSRAVPD